MSDVTYKRPVAGRPLATLGELASLHVPAGQPAEIVLAPRVGFIDRILGRIRDDIDHLRDETVIAIEARPFTAAMIALGIGIIGGSAIRASFRPRRPISRGW